MKRVLWLVVLGACLGLTTGASAQTLLVDENFAYPAGDSLGAHGWIGHSYSSPNNTIYVTSPGLAYPGYPSSSIGNAASLVSSGEDVHLSFAAQTAGTVYCAFLVNVSTANTGGDYFIHFGRNPWTTDYYARVFCKRDASSKLAFGLTKYNETPVTYTAFDYDLGTTYLIVIAYTFNTGSTTDDVMSLWVNPVCDPQPTAELAVTASTKTDATNIGAISLRQGSATNAPAETVDGIRVGPAWADVVCGTVATGACCAADGGCAVQTFADCAASGGVYQGDSSSCSPNPCPQPGACCALDNSCTFVLQTNCTGSWNGGACDPNPCLEPTGSCCAPDGNCTVTTQASCTGTWTEGGGCDPNTCPPPNGSCCYPDGSCALTLLADCAATWTMFGVCDPNTCPQPTGACCLPTGLCALRTATECAAASGAYQGNGTACSPSPCWTQTLLLNENFSYASGTLLTTCGWTNHSGTTNFIPVTDSGLAYPGYPSSNIGNAASMLPTGEDVHGTFAVQTSGSVYYAFLVNVSAATATGDYFTHLGTDPWSTTFPGRVFCRSTTGGVNFGISKLGTGSSVIWASDVFSLDTTHLVVVKYNIVGGLLNDTADLFVNPTPCAGEPAPLVTSGTETGNDPSGIGGIGLRQGGATTGSTQWIDGLRVGLTWADVVCGGPTQGACCAADGSCSMQLPADCAASGGVYEGEGSGCSPNPCPQLGTCCALDGSCTFVLQAACTAAWTPGGTCDPNPCVEPIGSCCALDGSCTVTTQANCPALWTEGGVCVPNTCPPPSGSCCHPDGSCTVTTLADCTDTWTMFGVCEPNTCEQPTGACCLATGLCTTGTAADCEAASGSYQGDFTACSPNPCPAPVRTLCEVAEDDADGVALLAGQRVKVQGIALCDGMNWSSTIREFQITDGTCCIDVFGGGLDPTVVIGDLVEITGTVANYNGKTEITTPDLIVTVLSSGNPVPPPGVATTGTLGTAGEPFESCLFTIHCVSIVSGTWPAEGADANLVIDDGSGPVTMRIDKDTNIDGTAAPNGPFTITGIGDQYDTSLPYTTGWQIKPRSLADFTFACGSGACCFPDGSCLVLEAAACLTQAGTYFGDGTNCDPNPCGPSSVDGGELDAVLGVRARPNPFSAGVSLRIAGPKAVAARVVIFDAGGRLVRTAWSGMLTGRALTVTWNGRDDSGHEAATGIYLVRLESGAGNAIGRLVKLR